MSKCFLKRTSLALFAITFSLLFAPNVSAENGQNEAEDTRLWSSNADDGSIYCDEATAALFTAICGGKNSSAPLTAPSQRYIDITMHVKEGEGHFVTESGNEQTRTNTYFYNDIFNDNTKPVSDRSNYAFVGWSTEENATEVDVEVDATRVSAMGVTDLYAVWSEEAFVAYHIAGGVWDAPDGNEYSHVMVSYHAGEKFRPLSPAPRRIEPFYDFLGWTTQQFGNGDEYTSDTDITDYYTDVFSNWEYNPAKIEDEMELDEVYDISAGVSIPLYKFTPAESGWYEVYTEGVEEDGTDRLAMVRLQNQGDHTLALEHFIDPTTNGGNLNVHLYYEMTAGETYYIRMGEMAGTFIRFNAGIRKAETATVTFDGNRGDAAYFDGVPGQTTKAVIIPVGEDIGNFRFSTDELTYPNDVVFSNWATESDPDPDDVHNYLIIEGDMTVFAQYLEMVVIKLDYNGGYSPYDKDETSTEAKFHPFDFFETPIDPKVDDPHKKFVGWSTDKNATAPDPQVIEGRNSSAALAEYLDGRTLYAIYDEPVSVTFNTIGGAWMMDDPDAKTYEGSLGKGHIFYGMAVMHYHPYVAHAGWRDQDGNVTTATSGIDASFTVDQDTVFTSILNYKLMADANGGGTFPRCGIGGCELRNFQVNYEGWKTKFSYDEVLEILGQPVPYDSSKAFLGFATDPDATEPDIIDGETYLEDIFYIYAIWGDDEYYVDDASETTWEKGDEEGLRVVIKRRGDDSLTFASFTGVSLGDEELPEEVYDAEEGSLVLTLHADFLETLEEGDYELAVHFDDVEDVMVPFTINPRQEEESSAEEDTPGAPNTGSNLDQAGLNAIAINYLIPAVVIVFAVTLGAFIYRKQSR